MMYRQGDVLVRKVDKIPEAAKLEPKAARVVLAYGEVTGHAHAIAQALARAYTMEQAGIAARRFLEVVGKRGAQLRHEEHAPIALPPGLYEITIQREYSPEAIRNVAD